MNRAGRSAIALATTAVIVGGGIWGVQAYIHHSQALVVPECTTTVADTTASVDPQQASNAATIAAVSVRRGMPARAASIALMTAMQESKLRNLSYGDAAGPDSRGLFQQRTTQGWGTEDQVRDPAYASNSFYKHLATFDYEHMDLAAAAQKVQRSKYPRAYADHEAEGRALASALTGRSPGAFACTLKRTTGPGNPRDLVATLRNDFGTSLFSPAVSGDTVAVPVKDSAHGWALAQWAVAKADDAQVRSVSYGGLTWTRESGRWERADAPAGQVRIVLATEADQD